MSDLQELKQKTIKYVPEIMELKFGCKGKDLCGNYYILTNQGWQGIEPSDKSNFRAFDPQEILGRDITLEDVIFSLNNNEVPYFIEQLQDCELSKDYWLFDIFMFDINQNKHYIDIELEWTPNKPLHEQSEETIKILNKIIK